jgi:glycosyltransferase involved in cell wall biosynthesis
MTDLTNVACPPKLSICIATYNRGKFIGETLNSILPQLEAGVELLVVDGASSDNTSEVMTQYTNSHPEIRYFRESENSGVDRDYDKAVGYALGEYCWLMSDDDLLRPGAVRKVLSSLENGSDLFVVNAEIRNADLSNLLLERRLNVVSDRQYEACEREQFFTDAANYLSFIGCVVIRRNFWLSRDRQNYYGSLFIHVGVIFQKPALSAATVIAEPLITIRDGNATWSARTFEVWGIKWPDLIWSFPDFPDTAKQAICNREQWRGFKFLFYLRAMGAYSLQAFRKHLAARAKGWDRLKAYMVAVFPGTLANLVVVFYYVALRRAARVELYDVLLSSHSSLLGRLLAKAAKK